MKSAWPFKVCHHSFEQYYTKTSPFQVSDGGGRGLKVF
jgi:hypothetical protein